MLLLRCLGWGGLGCFSSMAFAANVECDTAAGLPYGGDHLHTAFSAALHPVSAGAINRIVPALGLGRPGLKPVESPPDAEGIESIEMAVQVNPVTSQAWLTRTGGATCVLQRMLRYRVWHSDVPMSVPEFIHGVERPDCSALDNCASLSIQLRNAAAEGERVFGVSRTNFFGGWKFMKDGPRNNHSLLYFGTGRNNLAGWVFTKSAQGTGRAVLYANDGTAVVMYRMKNIHGPSLD
ncbi:MAG: hypothetical protein V4505_06745 [Pseudomonadota bacterium]